MTMMLSSPLSCLRLPPDPPPPSCLNAPRETLSPIIPPEPPDPPDNPLLYGVQLLTCSSSQTVCSSFTPSHHWLCSYSTDNPNARSVSHVVARMNFGSVKSDVFDLHLQILLTRNTQFEHQASSLNLASRVLSIAVQDIKDSREVVSYSAHWLLYLGDKPLFVTGASFPNDHYSLLTVNILFLWPTTQCRHLCTAPTEAISCIISELKNCRMASISAIGVLKRDSPAPTSLAASFTPRHVTGSTVQECGLARFTCYYVTVAFLTHYAVSSIDGSSQYDSLTSFFVAKTSEQECRRAIFTRYYVTAAPLSHYAVSSIDGSSQSQLCDFQTEVGARRPNLPKAFSLLSDVCSHMFSLNECNDCVFMSLSGITCWARHCNVEFRVSNPSKPSSPSSIFILSTSLEVKLELEIDLVSSVSRVGFKAESSCFSAKSSHTGLLTLNIVYGSRASHLKLWSVNNTKCINVVIDYQLFSGTIAMETKVELPLGFLHFAELDSPLDGFILSCFVMFFSFFRPLSMAPDSSASVVNDVAL